MKRIRFIVQGCGQCGVDVWKDYYRTEIVEVSDRAYELILGVNEKGEYTHSETFMGAEEIKEGEEAHND